MRELKFRAWHKAAKVMEMVTELSFDDDGQLESVETLCEPSRDHNEFYAADQVELLQYTGLKDNNGVEIYEGDVFEWDYWCGDEHITCRSGGVTWDEERAMFDFDDDGRPSFCPRIIVGNIYEHLIAQATAPTPHSTQHEGLT